MSHNRNHYHNSSILGQHSHSQPSLPSNGRPFTYRNGDTKIGFLISAPEIATTITSPKDKHQHLLSTPQHTPYTHFVDAVLQSHDTQQCNGCGWRPKYRNRQSLNKHLPSSHHRCVLLIPNLTVARFTAYNEGTHDPSLITYTSDIAFADVQFFFCRTCRRKAHNILLTSDHLAMGSSWPELQEQVIQLLSDPSWDNPNTERWMLQLLARSATELIGSSSHTLQNQPQTPIQQQQPLQHQPQQPSKPPPQQPPQQQQPPPQQPPQQQQPPPQQQQPPSQQPSQLEAPQQQSHTTTPPQSPKRTTPPPSPPPAPTNSFQAQLQQRRLSSVSARRLSAEN